MYITYLYSDEYNQKEKDNLIKKTSWFMDKDDLPKQVWKPHAFVYDEEQRCIGYSYRKPEDEFISLRNLFQPDNLMQYQVDRCMLFQIAANVLKLLKILSAQAIYSGFVDLSYLYVQESCPGRTVFISNPEMFQVGEIPSSYPWYPGDNMIFEEEFELFDEEKQIVADTKLIYKILTAASRGNVKIPPNQKRQETSYLYWTLLSKGWKEFFSDLPLRKTSYGELEQMIQDSLKEFRTKTIPLVQEKEETQSVPEVQKAEAYALILVLRQAEKSVHEISRELYLLQEKLEYHPEFDFAQGFVLGNKHPFARPFRHYGKEYRSQLGHVISDYSFGEAIIIGTEMMEAALQKKKQPSYVFLLLDGEIRNDKIFHIGLKKLELLKENWYTKLVLMPVGSLKGEGYQLLNNLCMKGKRQ